MARVCFSYHNVMILIYLSPIDATLCHFYYLLVFIWGEHFIT